MSIIYYKLRYKLKSIKHISWTCAIKFSSFPKIREIKINAIRIVRCRIFLFYFGSLDPHGGNIKKFAWIFREVRDGPKWKRIGSEIGEYMQVVKVSGNAAFRRTSARFLNARNGITMNYYVIRGVIAEFKNGRRSMLVSSQSLARSSGFRLPETYAYERNF